MTRRAGLAGVVVLAAFAATAILAPVISRYPPGTISGLPFASPSSTHWLGTDDVGHDIFSELLDGTRVSLLVAATVAFLSKALALLVGVVAGAARGVTDLLLMRGVDIVLAVPAVPLIVFVGAYLGGAVLTQVLVMAAILWAASARLIRSQALSTRERVYVNAARSFGAGNAHILWRHIVPAVLPVAVAALVRTAGTALLLEASLDFLGLGEPSRNSWGTMLYFANARGAFIIGSWVWWVIPPGVCIGLVVVATAYTGFLVEEWSYPRLAPARQRTPAPGFARVVARGGSPIAWSAQPDLAERLGPVDAPAE